jgi:type II secretory pathway pseudopilin PulG
MAGQRGFTYLGLLFAVAFVGLMLAGTGEVWHLAAKREREEQLLFVGRAFARALVSYRDATPVGRPAESPRQLEDLVEDRRHGHEVRRHLRRLYADPMTGSADWGLVRAGDGIVAIHSLAEGRPLRRTRFQPWEEGFAAAETYGGWLFRASPSGRPPAATDGLAAVPSAEDMVAAQAHADRSSPPATSQSADPAGCGGVVTQALVACSAQAASLSPADLQRCRIEAELRYAACLRGG